MPADETGPGSQEAPRPVAGDAPARSEETAAPGTVAEPETASNVVFATDRPCPPVRIEGSETPAPRDPAVGSRSATSVAIAGVAIAVLLAAATGFAAGFLGSLYGSKVNPVLPDRITVISPTTPDAPAAAAQAVLQSVVNIDVVGNGTASSLPKGHPSVPLRANGSGVAFMRSPGGGTYIITNNHVVEGSREITVTDVTGASHPARLVARDPATDIAVVVISSKLPLAQLGDSDKLTIGQLAVAIGSPFGLPDSVSAGVVSAIHRNLASASGLGTSNLVDMLQTDAAINPGNSGGALVDRAGRLIGINAAIFSQSGSSSGVGFAIPVNTAVRVAKELIRLGHARHPFIGVEGTSVDPGLVQRYGLKVDYGAFVNSVVPRMSAQQAGLRAHDVIVRFDDRLIRSMDDLVSAVSSKAVGSTVSIELYRGGDKQTIGLTVGERPGG